MIELNSILPTSFFYKRIVIISGIVIVTLILFSSIRFFCFFNIFPLILISIPILLLKRKLGAKGKIVCLAIIMALSLIIHIRHYYVFGSYPGWDSKGFIIYAKAYANGEGLANVIYRSPLYPFFVGIIYNIFQNPIESIVIIQHLLLIICVPLIFLFTLYCGFSEDTALLSSLFFSTNALTIRMAQFVMSEILFLVLLLFALFLFSQFLKRQSFIWALITGISFSAATHCRQLATPVFFIIVILALLQLSRKKWREILVLVATFTICNIPWSIHNYYQHGHFGLSAHLGANIFTKLSSYRLEKENGKYFDIIREPYQHVLEDLGLSGYTAPSSPENRWDINRIPHVLSDTLIRYHGFNYSRTSRLLTRVSVEGFCAHPLRYLYSVGKTTWTLLNNHIELYPKMVRIIPISSNLLVPQSLRPFVRGIAYVSGLAILAFILVIFCRRDLAILHLLPLGVLITGYFVTAAIQVGFTRYTVPWIPYLCICGAFLVTSIVDIFQHAGVLMYKNIEMLIKQFYSSRN